MDDALRQQVRERAAERCEYCRIHQDDDPVYRFHVEHILARKHGGATEPQNLALACQYCNLHKGMDLTGIDPATGSIVPIFHPRRDVWTDHFTMTGPLIVGLTPVGRVTVRVLKMNAQSRLQLRTKQRRHT